MIELELAMIRMGFDFETQGGVRVRCLDSSLAGNLVPVGTEGEILYTVPGAYAEIQVKWDSGRTFAHRWSDVQRITSGKK